MSWSATFTVPKSDIDVAPSVSPATPQENIAASQGDQVAAATKAARELAAAVGLPGDSVSVTVSGHANADHAPAEGWSNEFIQIQVCVVAE